MGKQLHWDPLETVANLRRAEEGEDSLDRTEMARAATAIEVLHETLLQLAGSLTLCDHMGDVAGDVRVALRRVAPGIEWEDLDGLRKALADRGVTTLQGTEL